MIENLEERVRDVMTEISPMPDDADTSFQLSNLGMDSLDVTELVISLEEEFSEERLAISDDDVDGFETLQNIMDYVEKNTGQDD